MTWQTTVGIHAVRAAGNTCLRVRYEQPLGESPAARHVRAVVAAFLAYADKKGRERDEKSAFSVPTYTVCVKTEPLAHCTAVHMTFTFGGERPPVTLTEYWCGDGSRQTARPPRRGGTNNKKSQKITKKLHKTPCIAKQDML